MSKKSFIDSNIIIYAYSSSEIEKKEKSLEVLQSENNIITIQVINEFIWVMIRKYKIDPKILEKIVDNLSQIFSIKPINQSTIKSAFKILQRYKFSYWDSLIIASALENNASTLITEDMQNGQIINNKLKIVNPFK